MMSQNSMLHTPSFIAIKAYIIRKSCSSSVPNLVDNLLNNFNSHYTYGVFSPPQNSETVTKSTNKIPTHFNSSTQIERFLVESSDYKSRTVPEYDSHQDRAREEHWKYLVWICSDGKEASKL
jgi:hypothetical protein